MSTPAPPRRWRDTWMERSETITDAWEVTKTYLGRFAEWVLFACMVVNVIEILPGVNVWPLLVNTVLGTQVIMLDVGGFALMTMADHAKSQGREKAAAKAEWTAWALIGIMILTLVLVTTPVLFPDPQVKLIAQNVEKVLILIRIGMTILYSKVIHGLRSTATALPVVVQDRLSDFFTQVEQRLTEVQQRVQTELQGVQQTLTVQIQIQTQAVRSEVLQSLQTELQGVQDAMQMQVQAVFSEVQTQEHMVLSQVQAVLSEHLQGVQEELQHLAHLDLQEVVQQVAQEAVQLQATQLVESINEVRKEVRTTITQAHLTSRSTAQRTGTLTTTRGTLSPSSPRSVPSAEVVSGTLITQEDTGTSSSRVPPIPVEQYIKEQWALNRIPPLNEIVQMCRCSKSTASEERRRLIPSALLERN